MKCVYICVNIYYNVWNNPCSHLCYFLPLNDSVGFQLGCTVQCRDKRPSHMQHACTICVYTRRACTHATCMRVYLLFIAINFLCVSLFGWTNHYSFLTETNICFSARMYTCLEFRMDQWNSRRMKFTAISTRFLNLGWE